MNEKIAVDCRFFSGEKPCVFHKEHGVKCIDCRYYSPVRERILIIKMGAKGDVLRTTCILTGLKEKYPDSYVTWVTEKGSQELLQNISLIDRILEFSLETVTVLQAERFALVLSLDSSVVSSALAEKIDAHKKMGFGLNREGKVYPFNPEAEEWFRMGIFDDVKRKNKKTYQEIMHEICGVGLINQTPTTENYEIIVRLREEEKEFARLFAEKHGIAGSLPVVGLNTGSGSRWRLKKWRRDGFLELIKRLHEEGAKVLLFGGEAEKERNLWLKENLPFSVTDTGSANSLRQFFSLLSLCDIVVAGDTLAVHSALGLKKKVVVLFGPTSPSEIELYGRGEKVIAGVDCAGCYREICNRKPTCMDEITVDAVFDTIRKLQRK